MQKLGAQSTVRKLWNLYSVSRLTMNDEYRIKRENRENIKIDITFLYILIRFDVGADGFSIQVDIN